MEKKDEKEEGGCLIIALIILIGLMIDVIIYYLFAYDKLMSFWQFIMLRD